MGQEEGHSVREGRGGDGRREKERDRIMRVENCIYTLKDKIP